jgi:hypothetical protein
MYVEAKGVVGSLLCLKRSSKRDQLRCDLIVWLPGTLSCIHIRVDTWNPLKQSLKSENCTLLGHYAASSGNFSPTFRDNLSVPTSAFKNFQATSYRKPEITQSLKFENCTLLGHYAASSGNFLPTFRDNLWVWSSGFKHLQATSYRKPEITHSLKFDNCTLLGHYAASSGNSFNLGARWGGLSTPRPGRFTRRKDPVPIV